MVSVPAARGRSVRHKGQWHPGTYEPLIDRATWDHVQTLLGQKIHRVHQLTYGSELIHCGHCGSPVTGEEKVKKTRKGDRHYIYYRCAQYVARRLKTDTRAALQNRQWVDGAWV